MSLRKSADKWRVLGIMSGTSIDSVDYAICRFGNKSARLLDYWQVEFPMALRKRLNVAANGNSDSHEVGQLHHDLGRFYALGAAKSKASFDLVGLHGQTIFHQPGKNPATLQIGEPAWMVEKFKVPVVSNFRAADIASGGQGAPMATMFHKHVFAERGQHVAVHNLGGISNVTSLDWHGRTLQVKSFDTGPANVLLDMAVRHFSNGKRFYDRDGAWARSGQVIDRLLQQLMRHPFLKKPPPKSTGREMFGLEFFGRIISQFPKESPEDILATLTEFTARSIALNYEIHLSSPVHRVILCGGGAENSYLRERIIAALPHHIQLTTSAQHGWPVQCIEPAAFALLAWLRWQKLPGNIPETTGASRPVLLGQVALPG